MASRSLDRPAAARFPRTVFDGVLDGVLRRIDTARAIRRQRARLTDLDPHILRDIGLTEDEAAREARRALWDVPDRWRR